jgi:hypothetical protein
MRTYNFVSVFLISAFAVVTLNAAIPAVVNAQTVITEVDSETVIDSNESYPEQPTYEQVDPEVMQDAAPIESPEYKNEIVPDEDDEQHTTNYEQEESAKPATVNKKAHTYGYGYNHNRNADYAKDRLDKGRNRRHSGWGYGR